MPLKVSCQLVVSFTNFLNSCLTLKTFRHYWHIIKTEPKSSCISFKGAQKTCCISSTLKTVMLFLPFKNLARKSLFYTARSARQGFAASWSLIARLINWHANCLSTHNLGVKCPTAASSCFREIKTIYSTEMLFQLQQFKYWIIHFKSCWVGFQFKHLFFSLLAAES